MFKKIIWATDGSDAADRALPYAKALAAGGSLLVLHCNEFLVGRPGGYSALADEDEIVRQDPQAGGRHEARRL